MKYHISGSISYRHKSIKSCLLTSQELQKLQWLEQKHILIEKPIWYRGIILHIPLGRLEGLDRLVADEELDIEFMNLIKNQAHTKKHISFGLGTD